MGPPTGRPPLLLDEVVTPGPQGRRQKSPPQVGVGQEDEGGGRRGGPPVLPVSHSQGPAPQAVGRESPTHHRLPTPPYLTGPGGTDPG